MRTGLAAQQYDEDEISSDHIKNPAEMFFGEIKNKFIKNPELNAEECLKALEEHKDPLLKDFQSKDGLNEKGKRLSHELESEFWRLACDLNIQVGLNRLKMKEMDEAQKFLNKAAKLAEYAGSDKVLAYAEYISLYLEKVTKDKKDQKNKAEYDSVLKRLDAANQPKEIGQLCEQLKGRLMGVIQIIKDYIPPDSSRDPNLSDRKSAPGSQR